MSKLFWKIFGLELVNFTTLWYFMDKRKRAAIPVRRAFFPSQNRDLRSETYESNQDRTACGPQQGVPLPAARGNQPLGGISRDGLRGERRANP